MSCNGWAMSLCRKEGTKKINSFILTGRPPISWRQSLTSEVRGTAPIAMYGITERQVSGLFSGLASLQLSLNNPLLIHSSPSLFSREPVIIPSEAVCRKSNGPTLFVTKVWCRSRYLWEQYSLWGKQEARVLMQPTVGSFNLFGTLCDLTTLGCAWLHRASAHQSLCSVF